MKALRIVGLNKSFDSVKVLKDVSLEVEAGQMLAVLGPSGCGKTTLLRCIAGFELPERGEIEVGGKRVYGEGVYLKPEVRRIGYVPQEGALFPHLTVEKNVAFGLSRQLKRSGRVMEMLALVGMAGFAKRMPHELSGGQQQRIALARALAPSPKLVLLDEPFSALDAGLRASLREDVRHALKEAGATAVMVTHDQEEALSMADVIAVMRQGHVVQTTDPVSLYKFPADPAVATFIGEATMLRAKVCDGAIDCPLGRLDVAPCCPQQCERATVMIRPEQFTIGELADGISARVVETTFYGHDALVRLRLDEHFGGFAVNVRTSGMESYQPGERVGLKINGAVMAYPEKQLQKS
ncbi:ABC transporter ATP-binding protein [Numidum massiliense]|uniref:ABC transporter ATP-binding protein n=1 Tax=Numidum massiliense TaxID=1522315 RepID=UPI0006D5508F|nr:ABC transporter ATP-binding protein [Numidum massiliense]